MDLRALAAAVLVAALAPSSAAGAEARSSAEPRPAPSVPTGPVTPIVSASGDARQRCGACALVAPGDGARSGLALAAGAVAAVLARRGRERARARRDRT